ncbi:hypothetical protein FRB99_000967 [Tulasnella sp. 403]|nr:hypothetical protein FRB99_000967 [Tulasnella sp. 403]
MSSIQHENPKEMETTSAPMTISTRVMRSSSIPTLPSPNIDKTSLIDSVLASSTLREEFGEPKAENDPSGLVEKLENENHALDQRLEELKRRLEAAEARQAELAQRRDARLRDEVKANN